MTISSQVSIFKHAELGICRFVPFLVANASSASTAIQLRSAGGGGASQQGFRTEERVAGRLQQPGESLPGEPQDGKPGQLDGFLQVRQL